MSRTLSCILVISSLALAIGLGGHQSAHEASGPNARLIRYVRDFPGATADVQIAACLAAILPGGTCDARDYAASTQTIAATVIVGPSQTLQFDPATLFRPSTPEVDIFQFEPNSIVRGFTFHCGGVPYKGNVFQNDHAKAYTNGEHTELANITVDPSCGRVTTGAALSLNSTKESTGVAFVNAHDWRTDGLGAGLYITASGNGFVNGNHFVNMEWSSSPAGWHIAGAGGSIIGNICSPCSYELNGVGANGVVIDGSGGAVENNLFTGDIWDTAIAVNITHKTASNNMFMGGYFDGKVFDIAKLNAFIPEGSASSQPSAILRGLRLNQNGEQGPSWETLDIFDTGSSLAPHKYLRTAGGSLQVLNNAFSQSILALDDSGNLSAGTSVKAGFGIPVSNLPSAADHPGAMIYVTDSTPISAEGQRCLGRSGNKALAFSNGSVWKCF